MSEGSKRSESASKRLYTHFIEVYIVLSEYKWRALFPCSCPTRPYRSYSYFVKIHYYCCPKDKPNWNKKVFYHLLYHLLDEKTSHKKCWELVATMREMKNQGYDVTGLQCASKLRSLKKTYKSIKDHNNKSGNSRWHWKHFEVRSDSLFIL